jgi:hypothetical protein
VGRQRKSALGMRRDYYSSSGILQMQAVYPSDCESRPPSMFATAQLLDRLVSKVACEDEALAVPGTLRRS